MKQRYTVIIPYDEPSYGSRTYVARIEVSAASEEQARARALDEFRKLEGLSSVRWAREVHEDRIAVESVAPALRPDLDLYAEVRGDVAVVQASGVVDEGTYAHLEEKLGALIDDGHPKIVLDCSGMKYINSSGIGSIVSVSSRGAIRLCCVPERVRNVLEMVGLNQVLEVFDSVDAAIASFG
jgi:anti-sigma B factor antagonist